MYQWFGFWWLEDEDDGNDGPGKLGSKLGW